MMQRVRVRQLRADLNENLFRVEFGRDEDVRVFYMKADELEQAWEEFDAALTAYKARSAVVDADSLAAQVRHIGGVEQ